MEDEVEEESIIMVGLSSSREDGLCRSKWSVGINLNATRLR